MYRLCHLYICNTPKRAEKKKKEEKGITPRDQFMRRVNYFLNIRTPPSAMTWPRVDPARIAIRPPSPPPCVFIPVKIEERDTSRATFISTSPNGYM
jgi:hypothetical protein